ncbi:MAG: hypothetical protein CENE_01253 [Candidatus Celerinatantimonas neptuna]|nr:MAG: hypothetical protein CENE_01253 [Candidatus Celerinatantimonas neptuna]
MAIKLEEVHCIASDLNKHLAFTDLCLYKQRYWLTYREASSHHHRDGLLVVLNSHDGCDWQLHARLHAASGELRDPKFTVTPQGCLWINCARINEQGLRSLVYELKDGHWSELAEIGEPGVWLWRTAWYNEFGLSFGYRRPDTLQLYKVQSDQAEYRLWSAKPLGQLSSRYGYPNETGIAFDSHGRAFCLLRRDADNGHALLGISFPPYQNWKWTELDQAIGGPILSCTSDDRLLAVVRLYEPARTSVCWIGSKGGQLTEVLTLPSGGDTSYAGMVWQTSDRALVSYYSSHQQCCAIYLATLCFS